MSRLAACALTLALCAPLAASAAQRTFVSIAGSDANPCSLMRPCRSFATAITQTNAGGEVIVLDSGGYGTVTITKAVSIIAPPGVYAGVSAFTDAGIIVAAGAADSVTLRGLAINMQGAAVGVRFDSGGNLVVDRCTVSGTFATGVYVYGPTSATVLIKNTHVLQAGIGISIGGPGNEQIRLAIADTTLTHVGAGIYVTAGSEVNIDNVRAVGSYMSGGTGIQVTSSPQHGAIRAHVTRSLVREFGAGVTASGTDAKLSVAASDISHTSDGVNVYGGGTVELTGNRIAHGYSDVYQSSGVVTSSGTNYRAFMVSPTPVPAPAGLL
jgi:hypothetical protein